MEFDNQNPNPNTPPTPALNSTPPEPASRPMATYAQQHPSGPPKSGGRNWLWIAAAIIVLALLAAGYWFFVRPKPAPNTNANNSQTQTTQTQNSNQAASPPIDGTTKTYSSTNFNLSFSYPANWTVSDRGGSSMTAVSPAMDLKNAAGQTISGKIILTIAQKGQNLTAFDKGDATAVLDSQKISYSNPTQNQRANTYLSFLQYASTTSGGALDSIDITGDYGYDKSQNIPKTDIANIDPLIAMTFAKCSDSACSATSPLSIASSEWNSASFATPLTSIFKSFAIN